MFCTEIYEIFKNTLVIASKSFRNDFAEQMFTLQLSKSLPRAVLKKIAFLLSQKEWYPERCAERKMRWERGWQLKSCIHLIYLHFCSFATGMANMSPNIFISKVLLKNPTEKNAQWGTSLKIVKTKQPRCSWKSVKFIVKRLCCWSLFFK